MKPEEFEKVVLDFLNECVDEVQQGTQHYSVEALVDDIGESNFTDQANKLFKQHKMTDKDGKPLRAENPAKSISQVSPEDGASFDLTSEEDRWLRANKLYGNDLLKQLGFKYNNS